jgi:hypothetical protein
MEISPKQTLTVKVGHYSFSLGIEIDSSLPFSQERRSAGLRTELFSAHYFAPYLMRDGDGTSGKVIAITKPVQHE